MADELQPDITTLTVQLLSAFVSNNSLPAEGLPDLIKLTRAALTVSPVLAGDGAEAAIHKPAVSVRKSLSSPDHIVSMIDGKPYKTLKRHLASHGLTPGEYRERYRLPKSYPLVASSYSEARRAVAAKLGLGRRPAIAAAPEAESDVTPTAVPSRSKLKKAGSLAETDAVPPVKKKPAAKPAVVASTSASGSDTKVAQPAKSSSSKAGPRKRLSLAIPQASDAKPGPEKAAETEVPVTVDTKAASPQPETAAKPKAPVKRKTATRSKSVETVAKASVKQPGADAQTTEVSKDA